MISNVKKGTICRSLSWGKFKRIIIRFKLFNRYTCFVILVSLITIMSNCFSATHKMLKAIKIFMTRTCIYME